MTNDAQIEAFLARAPFGILATSVEDQPYAVPKLFWLDKAERRIYFHSAKAGRTRDSILRNPQVSFSAAELGRVLPDDTACDFGVEYASVCVFGRARLVVEVEEKLHALRGIVHKFSTSPKGESADLPIDPEEMKRTSVYAIEIEAWSGKQQGMQ
jgi:nitroimidazol reductase NimA-like FMN-containing flavoprotein (pyridoxamine 5'-phosphate oxidase superfamily)